LGVWGFNPKYLTGTYLGNLPWEEVTFFLVVPYACIFIYEVLNAYFPYVQTKRMGHLFAFTFTLAGLLFGSFHLENLYTSSACLASAILTIGLYFVNRAEWFGRFVFAFLVCMIPFLIVNGILTGAITDEPIVWYNENHIMGPRILTIPLEDIFYNYAMLLPIAGIFEFLKRKNG
jgi:lycopene cyclase domain-containing protein